MMNKLFASILLISLTGVYSNATPPPQLKPAESTVLTVKNVAAETVYVKVGASTTYIKCNPGAPFNLIPVTLKVDKQMVSVKEGAGNGEFNVSTNLIVSGYEWSMMETVAPHPGCMSEDTFPKVRNGFEIIEVPTVVGADVNISIPEGVTFEGFAYSKEALKIVYKVEEF